MVTKFNLLVQETETSRAERPKNRRGMLVIAAGILLFAWVGMAGLSASAQGTGRGGITGIVTDPAGAVIPGAHVTVTNVAQNVSQDSVTNSTGYFEVDSLDPAVYKITVTAAGFEQLVRSGVTLTASAMLNIPLQLSIGRQDQTVVVTADASLLNTETGLNGQVLTTRQLESIPASGNNTMQFAELAPGVQSPNSQTYSMDGTLGWNGVSKFGTAGVANANEFDLDGAPNEGNQRGNAISMSPDETGEMKLDTSGFDASLGHTYGVTVTQVTKSGTNDIHGSATELYQDRRWAAMQRFQGLNYRYQQSLNGCADGPSTSTQCFIDENRYGQPGVHENNITFGIGGPVFIPKIYDGRNKFFWFVSGVNDIFTDANSNSDTLPTTLERGGNFSDLPVSTTVPAAFTAACPGSAYYGQYQIYNPFSVQLDSNGIPRRTPFCGNIIPSNLLTANAKMTGVYNSLLPTPNQAVATGGDYVYVNPQPQTFRQFDTREDYALSDKDHIFVRFTRAHYTKAGTGFTVGDVDLQQGPRWVESGSLGYNHVFTPRTNLDVTLGATNYETFCCYYPSYQAYSPSSVGLPSYADAYTGAAHTLPIFSVSSYQQVGQMNNAPGFYRTIASRVNLTHVQGKHTIRAGGEWRQQNYARGIQGTTSGTYSFDDTYDQQNNGTDSTYSQTNLGLSYAAFLMGVQTTASVTQQAPFSVATPYFAGYAGDTWRVTPRLTIIPGIRYEFEFGPKEKHDAQIVGFDANAALPIAPAAMAAYQASRNAATAAEQAALPAAIAVQGGPIYAGVNGASVRQWGSNYRFLPRIAIAYQIAPKTVIRGGYGLFFDTLNALEQPGTTDQTNFTASTSVSSSTNFGTNFVPGTAPVLNPFPVGANGTQFNPAVGSGAGAFSYAGTSPTIYDHNLVPARAERFYVGVQHQLAGSLMVEVAYVLAYNSKLTLGQNIDPVPASFYAGGTQPNLATNTLLSSNITNPFNINNFSSLQASNPTQYNQIVHSSYYTSSIISVASLLKPYPTLTGLTFDHAVGQSHFQELQINVSKRMSHGLSLMVAYQKNDQHDRDYYANAIDTTPSWEPSNNSAPYRLTTEGVYELPFGRGKRWASSGWTSAIFGGLHVNGSYEIQPGTLIGFSNLFYIGNVNASNILMKPPLEHTDLVGGHFWTQWLNPGNVTTTYSGGVCTYTGTTGFVTNPSCQPNSYNLRVFPTRVNGVRAEGPNTIQANVQRNFHIWERVNLETRFDVYNLLNRQVIGSPQTSVTNAQFGEVTSDGGANGSGNARWLDIQGHLRF